MHQLGPGLLMINRLLIMSLWPLFVNMTRQHRRTVMVQQRERKPVRLLSMNSVTLWVVSTFMEVR